MNTRLWIKLSVGSALALMMVSGISFSQAAAVSSANTMAGTYRCWSFNVGGRGGVCSSPPLVLKGNGRYTMSGESGKFTVKGDAIKLSASKLRGVGKILEGGMRIQFQYPYKGLTQTVTYLRQGNAKASIVLELTIKYPNETAMGWVNTVQLIPQGKTEPKYDALAYNDTAEKTILKAYYKKGIPGGVVYDVFTGTGIGSGEKVGIIDLTSVVKTPYASTITVATTEQTSRKIPTIPASSSLNSDVSASSVPGEQKVQNVEAPRCNPSLPHYTQPGCRD